MHKTKVRTNHLLVSHRTLKHLSVPNSLKFPASYPVLFVLLLVFCVSIHVGAHARVAGRAGHAADAVGGVLSLDAQVWLLILLLLRAAITASWGEHVCHYNVSFKGLSLRHQAVQYGPFTTAALHDFHFIKITILILLTLIQVAVLCEVLLLFSVPVRSPLGASSGVLMTPLMAA